MQITDENYLRLQYWDGIHKKSGSEFQSFFEGIMQCLYNDFKKIRPYGNIGDKKNDGFREREGIYYQVYAPKNPLDKQKKAVDKLINDFDGIYQNWNESFPIKEFIFVFNDKGEGLSPVFFTEALSSLQTKFTNIKFSIFTPQLLELEFFKLKERDKISLGFSTDKTKFVSFINDYFEGIIRDLDRGCLNLAFRFLERIKDTIYSMNNETIKLEFDLLDARLLRNLNKLKEAEVKYISLSKIYPSDPRSLLYLAELQFSLKKPDKNQEFLKKAEKIDPTFWLLNIEKLLRDIKLDNPIDVSSINENTFPDDKRDKSICYRMYALCYEKNGIHEKADQFIEKAIQANPDRVSNYQIKLSLLKNRLWNKLLTDISNEQIMEVLACANEALSLMNKFGSDNQQYKLSFLLAKIDPLAAFEESFELEQVVTLIFELIIGSDFDDLIEEALITLLSLRFPSDKFNLMLDYLIDNKVVINENLGKALVIQFLMRGKIVEQGKIFFSKIGFSKALDFIKALQAGSTERIMIFVNGDMIYFNNLVVYLKEFPELQKSLIKTVSDNDISKEDIYWLFFFYENNQFKKALEYLLKINISTLTFPQLKICAEIAYKAENWEKEIEILKLLIKIEKNDKEKNRLTLELFKAYCNLENFLKVIEIGESLISDKLIDETLNQDKKEILLAYTINAYLKREQYENGLKLLLKNNNILHSFYSLINIQAEVYLKCGDLNNAIASIVKGVKQLKKPSDEQYGSLFEILIRIGDNKGFSLDSENQVKDNYFIKLNKEERWFHLGDDQSLDAIEIKHDDRRYLSLINKQLKDFIQFPSDKYAGVKERKIENILSIEKYIFWKARDCFHKLSASGWEKGQIIEVPIKDNNPDLSNLIAFMKDIDESNREFYEAYISSQFPLAFLAFQQGGLLNAIGKIVREERGYVNLSDGSKEENVKQFSVASKINSGSTVYVDATSAIFLIESGLFKKVKSLIPSLKFPQSVINYLYEIANKFRIDPKIVGSLSYLKGKLIFSPGTQEGFEDFRNNIIECMKIIEKDVAAIVAISNASKQNVFCEQKIQAELVDACILAQRDNGIVLTEDYRYLFLNAFETKKNIPEYCSSFILIRNFLNNQIIPFSQYLDYFNFLSLRHCRFLFLNAEDLFLATFGDSFLGNFQPENIKKLNLQLVLADEYGVSLRSALKLVVIFFMRIILNDAVTIIAAEKIFMETIAGFLRGRTSDRREAAFLVDRICKEQLKLHIKKSRLSFPMKLANKKIICLENQLMFSISVNMGNI
jgi:tetratricopeptide (TPR) repeat protein